MWKARLRPSSAGALLLGLGLEVASGGRLQL